MKKLTTISAIGKSFPVRLGIEPVGFACEITGSGSADVALEVSAQCIFPDVVQKPDGSNKKFYPTGMHNIGWTTEVSHVDTQNMREIPYVLTTDYSINSDGSIQFVNAPSAGTILKVVSYDPNAWQTYTEWSVTSAITGTITISNKVDVASRVNVKSVTGMSVTGIFN